MIAQKIDDAIWKVMGGYTPEEEEIGNEENIIQYELESMIPTKEALEEVLAMAMVLRDKK